MLNGATGAPGVALAIPLKTGVAIPHCARVYAILDAACARIRLVTAPRPHRREDGDRRSTRIELGPSSRDDDRRQRIQTWLSSTVTRCAKPVTRDVIG